MYSFQGLKTHITEQLHDIFMSRSDCQMQRRTWDIPSQDINLIIVRLVVQVFHDQVLAAAFFSFLDFDKGTCGHGLVVSLRLLIVDNLCFGFIVFNIIFLRFLELCKIPMGCFRAVARGKLGCFATVVFQTLEGLAPLISFCFLGFFVLDTFLH